MKKISMTLVFLFSLQAQSHETDTYNTYQWNRKNHIEKNGRVDTKPWFEWWYYKIVLPSAVPAGGDAFYAVYGVVNPWDADKSLKGTRAYVGFGNFTSKFMANNEYEIADFSASYDKTEITVGKGNLATDKHFEGIAYDELQRPQYWSVDIEKKWAFNAMGWAMRIPNITNIFWYPALADANCTGHIVSDNKLYQFTNAPCYQDRNWGTSFPEWWTWIVSNNFNEDKTAAIAIGGGLPEVLGHKVYSGVSVGFKYQGREYTFRPNDFDLVKTDVKWGRWRVTAQNPLMRIEVSAHAPVDSFMDIQFMTPQGEIFHDYQSLTGNLTVKIYQPVVNSSGWHHTETLTSSLAGIEYGSKNSSPSE